MLWDNRYQEYQTRIDTMQILFSTNVDKVINMMKDKIDRYKSINKVIYREVSSILKEEYSRKTWDFSFRFSNYMTVDYGFSLLYINKNEVDYFKIMNKVIYR